MALGLQDGNGRHDQHITLQASIPAKADAGPEVWLEKTAR
jgi:hypothetical protein